MADRRRRVKTDDDSEGSLTGSDVEVDEKIEAENSLTETPEKDASSVKVAEGSEYESAEEQTEKVETDVEASPVAKEPEESLSDVVDEEGGEEGIAESEDVEGDFLSGDLNEDASGESEEEEGEYVEEERQQGDGEECSPNDGNEKELDFDEDRRNPQYIPKKGIFYEHDDRNNEEEKEKEEEPPRDRKKKLWNDEGKWGHDRFREEEQFPKSRNELIEAYGYDIRNEDGPPRARRRRRYGRGPMKYDRSWEDVTAYGREKFQGPPRGSPRGRRPVGGFRGGPRGRGRGRNHFDDPDQLHERHQDDADVEKVPVKDEETDEASPAVIIISSKEFPSLPTKESPPTPRTENPPEPTYFNKKSSSPPPSEPKSVRTLTFENSNYGSKPNPAERDVPPRRGKTAAPFTTDRGVRRPNLRGGRGMRGEGRGRGRGNNMRQVSPRFMENKVGSLATDMEQLTVDNGIAEVAPQIESNGVSHPNNELPNMAHKGAGDSSGRPKRYSSLRQRSLPETNAYQPPPPAAVPQPHPTYYDAGYSAPMYAPTDTCVPTPSTQSQTVNSSPIMNPSYQTYTPPTYTESYGLRLPVTQAPRLFPQVSVPTAQPILAPPPCITPAPNMMSFAPPPPPAGYQFAYQQYTTPPPPPPPAPPSDMYQTGITYYYPQSQAPPVRPTVQKRPKAAIPILPPPEREGTRTESKDNNHASSNRNFSDNPEDGDVSIRTDSTQQLQPTVGVES